ncbi:succinyl-diaminopimelate desuccinylase [Caldanaerobius fijiensis DSM 17918]|uniref:Succinyl-diaminopimelate desuccinylase n=1 Tax=Caldanaerobius fijiensis DSM 17918 TaxID=1121256 RepID=A0A1M4TUI8_9THEO|nr:dipeptidase PepV [Caldanaerobius fijiensis]SHE48149.1 succinyl-diaminopimelate desuccinylase [Caldanaerobius fijiensis DSM 17918]
MKFDALIEGMAGDIIKSTQDVLKYRSVQGEPLPGAPFGEGVKGSLDYVLSLSEKMGFETKNLDGYVGYAQYGDGDEMVGILVHLDVVPEGDGWTYPPYSGEIHDNRIYGRGAIDDKGPAIACLYALKAIKDSGVSLKRKVRIIFGTNEESGWKDIEYYKKHEIYPDLGFTPDANFPLIFAEKGILTFKIKMDFETKKEGHIFLKHLKGGNAANMVPDYCEACLSVNPDKKDYIKMLVLKMINEDNVNVKLLDRGDDILIKSYGISAHGSTPEKGVNAIMQLIMILYRLDFARDDVYQFISYFAEKVGMDYTGKNMSLNISDDISGGLTFNIGVINVDDKKGTVEINIRYPVTASRDTVESIIKRHLPEKFNYVYLNGFDPIHVSTNSVLAQTLLKVYRQSTGDDVSNPIAIGGGTYARAFKNFVAFGPVFPGGAELAHQKDEYIEIEHLIKLAKIYSMAIYELSNI